MRTLATYETVVEAAQALIERGEQPSSRLIRDEIGGGSLATIQRHLRRWHSGPVRGDEQPSAMPLPAPVAPQAAPSAAEPARIGALLDRLETLIGRLGNEMERRDALAPPATIEGAKEQSEIRRLSEECQDLRDELEATRAELAVYRQLLSLNRAEVDRMFGALAGGPSGPVAKPR